MKYSSASMGTRNLGRAGEEEEEKGKTLWRTGMPWGSSTAAACRYDDGAGAGAGGRRSVSGNVHVDVGGDVLVAVAAKRMVLLRPARLSHRPLHTGEVLRPAAGCNVAAAFLCSVIRRWAGGGGGRLLSQPTAWWVELRTMGGSGPAPSSLYYTRGAVRRLGFCCRRRLPTVVACYIPGGLLRWQQLARCACVMASRMLYSVFTVVWPIRPKILVRKTPHLISFRTL